MTEALRVIVVGGSLGGLSAALYLRGAGCAVQVHERSKTPLDGRGAGIIAHPATVRYLTQHDILSIDQISVPARWIRYRDRDGCVAHEEPCRYLFTSYYALYRSLSECFAGSPYRFGEEMIAFEQDSEGVTVQFAGGRSERCDLLVCADGIHSTARRLLLPEVDFRYAGYVGWRGTISEGELGRESFSALNESITYVVIPNSHILAYPIRGRERTSEPDRRLINWVWYRNVAEGAVLNDLMTDREGTRQDISLPPGGVQKRHVRDLHQTAKAELPPLLAEMVVKSREPFVQAIFDIEVPRMVFGRICLIGDAAFVARPHAAAGTAKAAEDAWQLAQAVGVPQGDLTAALARWERGQLAVGRNLVARAREAGNRAQFEANWRSGDPLPFGLYRTGDGQFAM
jgi:2,6-dihydroxypyridine 3-monooxygenase